VREKRQGARSPERRISAPVFVKMQRSLTGYGILKLRLKPKNKHSVSEEERRAFNICEVSEMELPEEQLRGLNPKEFEGKELVFKIGLNEEKSDSVTPIPRKTASGREYVQLSLHLEGNETYPGERQISFLFPRDLRQLKEAWGKETRAWIGKEITVSSRLEGEYYRWILQPRLKATEEVV